MQMPKFEEFTGKILFIAILFTFITMYERLARRVRSTKNELKM